MQDPSHHHSSLPPSLKIRSSQRLNNTSPLTKPRPKDAIGILKHAILQTNNNKLTALEPGFDQSSNILCMWQIERSVYLVENVHGRWLELEQGHDERQGDEGSLTTG